MGYITLIIFNFTNLLIASHLFSLIFQELMICLCQTAKWETIFRLGNSIGPDRLLLYKYLSRE